MRLPLKYFNLHSHFPARRDDEIAVLNLFPDMPDIGMIVKKSGLYFSVGLHPWHLTLEGIEGAMAVVERLAAERSVKAAGECGLDRLAEADLAFQREVLIRHFEIAESAGKPLIIHCVRAYPELIKLKKELRPVLPWICHGFNASRQAAEQLVRHGIHVSFGPALLKSRKLQELVADFPADHLFLETDDKDTEIGLLYQKACECRNVEMPSLKTAISENAERVFGIRLL